MSETENNQKTEPEINKFNYATFDALKKKTEELQLHIPFSDEVACISEPFTMQSFGKTIPLPNRIAIQPMEGFDSEDDGSPGPLTARRYRRFAGSGAALIWFEAVAIFMEARSNPHQLAIDEKNVGNFQKIVENIKNDCMKQNGFEPLLIMQATHSGRYSKPNGVPEPIIAYQNPLFEGDNPIDPSRIVTDDTLKKIEERMGVAARLAERAGFDGVDVKSCHRYLFCEMLSAYNREGEYGGTFENRTRLLRNSVDAALAATNSFLVTSRLNVYDGYPYPYGFGVSEGEGITPDLTEAKKLIQILHVEKNIPILDITYGNPYTNPHVNRPADTLPYPLPEHPLCGIARGAALTGEIQKAFPDLAVISSAMSYVRQYAPMLAAGMLREGSCTMTGFGRMAFAYPDFANDILHDHAMNPSKCCITCGQCSALMRQGRSTGCVVRDREQYSIKE